MKLVGATDIFRKQQILSQQSQKVDQLISEVYDNIKTQRQIETHDYMNLIPPNILMSGM